MFELFSCGSDRSGSCFRHYDGVQRFSCQIEQCVQLSSVDPVGERISVRFQRVDNQRISHSAILFG